MQPSTLKPPPVVDGQDHEQPAESTESEGQGLDISAFVDAYYSMNYGFPKPQNEKNRLRAFDATNGFALSWAGVDLNYDAENYAGTVALRFGPSAARLAGADADHGLEFLQQAYGTFKPSAVPWLSLDFGKFNTIYGAEAAESHLNFNYTRGLLYWLGQPFFHTGLRANLDLTENFWMTVLAVNGWDNSVDNNSGKTFGVQFSTSTSKPTGGGTPLFGAHLGYAVGPEQRDYGVVEGFCSVPGETLDPRDLENPCNTDEPLASTDRPRDAGAANSKGLRHFIDLVLTLNPHPDWALLLNADFGIEQVRQGSPDLEGTPPPFESESWWGVSAMGRWQVVDRAALAARYEVFGDPKGRSTASGDPFVFDDDQLLQSITLTGEYTPHPSFILRLDNRLDVASTDIFPQQLRSYGSTQFTSTLGVVAVTN